MMICIPIKKKIFKALFKELKKSQKLADIVEIWFDELNSLKEEELNKIFKIKKKPFIYKSKTNIKNIKKIIKYGIEFMDLDASTQQKTILEIKKLSPKTKLILSFHDYKKTPNDKTLRRIAQKIISKKADIIKIATFAKEFFDSLRMLHLLSELSNKGQKAICLCMGKKGELTRVSGHLFGNYLMYAPLKESGKTAKGQINIKKLKILWD